MQEIVDRPQTRVLEIGGPPWPDTLEILKRRREDLVGGVHNVKRKAILLDSGTAVTTSTAEHAETAE